MKTGASLVRFAWIMLALLAIGSIAFELNSPQTKEQPFAASFDPSGTAAFAELLRQEGYQVQIATLVPVIVPRDTLAIAFVERDDVGLPLEAPPSAEPIAAKKPTSRAPGGDGDTFAQLPQVAPPAIRVVVSHLRASGNALILGFDSSVDLKVDHEIKVTVTDLSGKAYAVTLPPGSAVDSSNLLNADASLPAWLCGGQAFANLDQVGKGRVAIVGQGEVAMNSYIDRTDNARLLLDQIHLLAPAGSKVEIIDGSVSGATGGLIDLLGPWAHGVQLQVILIGVVIVFSLGKRFGLADETVRVQRGARDLLDGIADTYNRGNAAKAALQAVLQEGDRAARRQLKLAVDAPLRKRNELLPSAVSQALTACEHAMMQDPTPAAVLALSRQLETELELFLKRRKPNAKRPRRRVNSA
ncbi:MAG: hypothetical protein ACYC96_05785 [Fimbriimonadaceae bacterium]